MATTTEWIEAQKNPMVLSGLATIDINETTTLGIPCGGRAIVRIGFPTMTGTTATFLVQDFPSTTLRNSDGSATAITVPFRPLYDGAGNQVSVTVTDDSVIDVPELSGCYAFKIVSASAEAAARQIEVQCVGPYPTSPGVNSLELEPGATVTANQGTKTATATNAWLTTPYTPLGQSLADDALDALKATIYSSAGNNIGGGSFISDQGDANALLVDASVRIYDGSTGTMLRSTSAAAADGTESAAANPLAISVGGATPYSYLSTGASDDATVVKASAGTLYTLVLTNTNAAVRYVKFYNKATAPGTGDTPVLRIAVPGSTTGGGVAVPIPPQGIAFSTGISFRMVTGVADNDGTDVAANEVIIGAMGYA